MTDKMVPNPDILFDVLCRLADLSAATADLYTLLNDTLQICLEHLPIDGAVVWLRSDQQDMFAPGASRLPAGCSTSAMADDVELLQALVDERVVIFESGQLEPLVVLPEGVALALSPIQSEDIVVGLLGYVASSTTLQALIRMIEANANILSAPLTNTWLRRQQAEADDVAQTLFLFANDLRTKNSLDDILSTLNNLALRVFNCDWSAVYAWSDEMDGQLCPVQIVTRVGGQSVVDEPAIAMVENPLLEMVFSEPLPTSIRDLREQPTALPLYLERHALRGLVLVPIKHESAPMGLLTLGYRMPMVTLSSRASSLAQGLARMVAVALERTRARQQ
jgi:hypothetical protein